MAGLWPYIGILGRSHNRASPFLYLEGCFLETGGMNEHHEHCEAGALVPRTLPQDVDFGEFDAADYGKWKETATASLKGASFEKSMYTPTFEGITLEPIYTAGHTEALRAFRAFPGAGTFLRGTSASGYLSRPWEIAQPCDAALPKEANEQLRHDLAKGATAVAPCLDRATLNGIDPHGQDAGAGASLATLDDVEALLESIDVEGHDFHVYAGASCTPLLGFLSAFAKKRGIAPANLKGCIGADPAGAYLENGVLFCDTDELFDEMAHSIYWTEREMPGMRTVLVRGGVYHNGGASAVQEVACAMASAIEAVRAMRVRHLDIEAFSRHLRFEFPLSSHFFMEIAKIRAARVVWAQIAGAFGGSAGAQVSSIFARTSFFTKTICDPYVNMLRNTTEAFSGVLGGVDGLTVGRFDEALSHGRPGDEFSRRMARNTQILLKEEFGLLQPVDPAGGSWYLEALTDALARKIWEALQKIENDGGFLASIRAGTIQADIGEVLRQRFKKLAERSDRAVGTNMYSNAAEPLREAPAPDGDRSGRAETLRAFRASRDPTRVRDALENLVSKGLEGGELIDLIAAAAEAGATMGEVRASLNDGNEFGDADKIPVIGVHRRTEQYEAMRRCTERFKADTGSTVRVFLANMGPVSQHKARADFITGFMEVAGFEVLKNDGFSGVKECADSACASGADIVVICSSDDAYPDIVPPLAQALKNGGCSSVFLAGAPKEEFRTPWREAGVDDFISVRSDCLAVLTACQKAKGML
jgi:methylmalonyl-CoA mutase